MDQDVLLISSLAVEHWRLMLGSTAILSAQTTANVEMDNCVGGCTKIIVIRSLIALTPHQYKIHRWHDADMVKFMLVPSVVISVEVITIVLVAKLAT